MEEGDSLNNKACFYYEEGEGCMTPGDFFQTLIYILMATSFIALLIIFLQVLRGQEDEAK
jgi:hypothetical protein